MRILGLDLGIASIGWALIEQSSEDSVKDIEIKAWGSRIFEPGMEDDIEKGKGKSRCVQRRLKHSLRIQYWRRRKRKKELISLLQDSGFLPKDLQPKFFVDMDSRLLRQFPKEQYSLLGHIIPYLYRKNALDRQLEPYELGRAIYHLAQRRGYLSNRKNELKDQEETGKVLTGIKTLKKDMQEKGARTVGEYFCMLNPEEERIRGNYTERSMYEEEFSLICERQRKLISSELEKKLHKAIFYQRKLKSKAGLVGECSLESGEKKCKYSYEEAQLYRIYVTVDNLRIKSKDGLRKLDDEERRNVIQLLNGFSSDIDVHGKIKLKDLAKILGLPEGSSFTLGDEEKYIYGNELHSILFYVFGESCIKMSKEEQNKFLHDLDSIEKDAVLRKRLENYWKLDEEHVRRAMGISLPEEYCALSLKALRIVLPDLEAGSSLHEIEALHYLEKFDKSNKQDFLPPVDKCLKQLRNPIVHRTLTELRKVVNDIIARYGKPDKIRIELARSLKNSNKERERIARQNSEQEKANEAIVKRILNEVGINNPSKEDILRVRLWDECGGQCPYTGQSISFRDLFSNAVQIEHIIPFSRSFDNSFKNKTLCYSKENARKNNRTPYEAYSHDEYQDILKRVKFFKGDYAEIKLTLFETKEVQKEDFIARNLNDTRYASRIAMEYLGLLYGGVVDGNGKRRVFACSGGCTAHVRRAWGANFLLGDGEKDRSDHRHHAIDALTISVVTPEIVRIIANISKEEYCQLKQKKTFILANNLYEQAKAKLEEAFVSHHIVSKVKGALHDETFYSVDSLDRTCSRVKLEELSPDDLMRIKDKAIRLAVIEALGLNEAYLEQVFKDKKKNKKEIEKIKRSIKEKFKDEQNYPELKDKSGRAINKIKAVKVVKNDSVKKIGSGDGVRYVKTNGNYLLAIYEQKNNEKESWIFKILTLMNACGKLKKGEPLFDKELSGYTFKFSLKKGDLITLKINGEEKLYIVRSFSCYGDSSIDMWVFPLTEARAKDALKVNVDYLRLKTAKKCLEYEMQKVTMNIFGEIRRAND